MQDKRNKKSSNENSSPKKVVIRKMAKNIEEINLADFCTQMMLTYGANINLARSIPNVKDGLKVVGRRILYAMYKDERLKLTTEPIKCAKLVGTVLGVYHPHGDVSVYESLVSLGQYWKYYPLLVKPQGAYGNILGDGPAAMRYTEVNMSEFAWDVFFEEWDDLVLDFKDNYSGSNTEAEFLPSRFPTALIFGTTGMGYALYAGIPQFNLKEVADLTEKLLDNPDYKKCTLIPDFANKCHIVNTDFEKIFDVGEGKFRIRAEINENDAGNLEIRSTPYQTNWITIEAQIQKLIKDGKLTGVVDAKDMSTGKEILDMRLELILKKGSDIHKIKETLYKSTSLETTFVVNFEFTDDYENVHYNIKSYILDWIDFRIETKKRYYIGQYNSMNKEFHMLETIIRILKEPSSDKTIDAIVRNAEDRKEIISKLIKKFNITDLQADVIASFQKAHYSKSSIANYVKKYEELIEPLKTTKAILEDDSLLVEEVRSEIRKIKQKYGRPRQCDLIDVDAQAFIPNTEHTVIVTKNGYIKKLPKDETSVGFLETGDKILSQIDINNRESILLFNDDGKCYGIDMNDIMSCPIDSIGINLRNMIPRSIANIVGIVKKPDAKTSKDSLLFVTKSGLIKKTELGNFNNANRNGLIAILLKKTFKGDPEGDEMDKLKGILVLPKNKDIIIYTTQGMALRFNSKEVPSTLRSSSGVIGMRLLNGNTVAGMVEVDRKKKYMVIVTSSGNAKKCLIDNFDKSSRAKEGITIIGLTNKEQIVGIVSCDEKDTVKVYLNTRTDVYDVSEFKDSTKLAKGKKLIPCRNNEHIITIE